jgi:hypothetical protein
MWDSKNVHAGQLFPVHVSLISTNVRYYSIGNALSPFLSNIFMTWKRDCQSWRSSRKNVDDKFCVMKSIVFDWMLVIMNRRHNTIKFTTNTRRKRSFETWRPWFLFWKETIHRRKDKSSRSSRPSRTNYKGFFKTIKLIWCIPTRANSKTA